MNPRDISLIDIVPNPFGNILPNHFVFVRWKRTHSMQCCLRQGRDCVDQIRTLRPLRYIGISSATHHSVLLAAFDSAERQLRRNIPKSNRIFEKYVRLLSTHYSSKSVHPHLQPATFTVFTPIRCSTRLTLSSVIFDYTTDWTMQHPQQLSRSGTSSRLLGDRLHCYFG